MIQLLKKTINRGVKETPQSFPDLDFPLASVTSAYTRIAKSLEEAKPLSFMRLGDGEGLAMSIGNESWVQDIIQITEHWGPVRVSHSNLLALRDELHLAFSQADIVGLREDVLVRPLQPKLFKAPPARLTAAVKSRFPLRDADANLPPPGCRRLALTNRVLSEMEFQPGASFTSAWANWDLVMSGMLYQLLDGQREIGVISCHSSLPGLIEAFMGIRVKSYLVPKKFAGGLPVESGSHFPGRFEQLRDELSVDFPGMLFLVGAGITGNIYCHWIKQRGGIALDIGAVMDSWIGLGSRPLVVKDRFCPSTVEGGVPEKLLLNPDNIRKALAIDNKNERGLSVIKQKSVITDRKGAEHRVHSIQQWGIEFYMLEEANLWLSSIKGDSWEVSQREFFFNEIRKRKSRVAIDIGANNGIYTLLMGAEPRIEQIYTFEPCDPHFSMMEMAIKKAGFKDRCHSYHKACSDNPTVANMYVFPNKTPSLHQFVDTKIKSDEEIQRLGAKLNKVQSVVLDDIVDLKNQRIAIKIDTEGHEMKVIKGAAQLLRNNDCFLQIESFETDITLYMAKIGYVLIQRIANDWYFEKQTEQQKKQEVA